MQLDIIGSSLYTSPQIYSQTTECAYIGLLVSGLEYMRIYSPDKKLVANAGNLSLLLLPKNFRLEFAFGVRRENYITLCQIPSLIWNPSIRKLELRHKNSSFELSPISRILPGRLEEFRQIFIRTAELVCSAIPASLFAAEQLMSSVIAEFITDMGVGEQAVPAIVKSYKQRIDEDDCFRYSLAETADAVGFSPLHLRRLFTKHYRVGPSEYRARLRLKRIAGLFGDSNLSLKEIADAVGMKNVTHLHFFIKKRCGMTPSQLRRNLNIGILPRKNL